MAFPEHIKGIVRKQAHLRCCICRTFGVEVHHIIPVSEGGPDTEENAAPLCPSCHETYGANPVKRKIIREARDVWYEICATTAEAGGQLAEVAEALKNLPTKADVERLALRGSVSTLGVPQVGGPDLGRYSFGREEFIHPLVVQELLGCLSDPSETVLAVDLLAANDSNRFYGEYSVRAVDGRTWVESKGPANAWFMYSHIGRSPSGIEIVECCDCGGGTGVFVNVGFFAIQADRALGQDREGKLCTRDRLVLRTLGVVGLGDRYSGAISYDGSLLSIGPDVGWFCRGSAAARTIPVR